VCGGTGGVTEDDDGFSCMLCGAPRVLVDPPVVRSGREKPLLERAKRLRARRVFWGVTAGLATASGLFALAVSSVLALVMHLGHAGAEVAAALVLAPLLFGALGFARVRRTNVDFRRTLDDAELAVVGEITEARGGSVDAGELSRLLRVSPARAEQLSAQALVEGFLTGTGTSTSALPEARLRVDAEAQSESDTTAEDLETERRERRR
jgi:hypothetical protein